MKQEHSLEKGSVFLEQDTKLDPLQDGISAVELLRVSGSDLDIANAARVSYGRVSTAISDRDKKLIEFLMEHDHTSPFEHNQLSFRVKAPIFVARQWMRHRMNSYNEISYRYVQIKTEFYIPTVFRYQDTVNKQGSVGTFSDTGLLETYKKTLETCHKAYEDLLAAGVCREQARALMPVGTYTEFIFTCNLHSLMHFLKLRLSAGAQSEIKVYAKTLLRLAHPHFPLTLEAWRKKHLLADEWQDTIKEWTDQLGDGQ